MVKVSLLLSFLTMFGCVWAARMCNSCGSECVAACGTRYFRSCCFNYLRKKRGPDNIHPEFLKQNHDWKDSSQWTKLPVIALTENFWKDLPSDLNLDQRDETVETILQALYI